jgi:nucleoid-associated protein YgaU
VDVRTGERVVIPSHSKINFIPDATLSKIINEPFAMFEPVELEEDKDSIKLKDESQPTANEFIAPPETEKINFVYDVTSSNVINEPFTISETDEIEEDKDSIELQDESQPTEDESAASPETEHKKRMPYLIITVVAVLIVAILFFFLKYDDPIKQLNYYVAKLLHKKEKTEILKQNDDVKIADNISEDKIDTIIIDSIIHPEEKPIINSETKEEITPENIEKKQEPVIVKANNAEKHSISGGVKKRTIAKGERLTLIALQEYGNKDFWIYLYEENKAIIKNPEKIMAGMIIVIPPASKYSIDKNDPESIKKAKELQNRLK